MPAPGNSSRPWLVASALALALSAQGHAAPEPPRWPTDQELAQARARPIPDLPANRIPAPRLPQVANLPAALSTGLPLPTALEALAPTPTAHDGGLRIYVTLAMPRASLRALADQAERSGAVLVLRGLHRQSMRETLTAMAETTEGRAVGWLIDPQGFDRHGVEIAPTFVLTPRRGPEPAQACSTSACTLPDFVSIAGDVSLDHALESIARRSPNAADDARRYLAKLRR